MTKESRIFAICLLSIMVFLSIKADTIPNIDSLIRVASDNRDPAKMLSSLKMLSVINREKPKEVLYLKKLLDEATRVDSVRVLYDALFNLSRHYYNLPNSDSLTYWVQYTDSVVRIKKDNPDVYYDVHSLICKDFLYQGYIDLSIDEAIKLQNRAQETGHIYGMICSSEALGVIYQTTHRDSLSIIAFQDALDKLEAIDGDLYYRIYIVSNLIRSNLQQHRLDNAEKLLNKYAAYLDQRDEINRKNKVVYSVNWHRWLMYSFYVDLYVQKNKIDKATHALKRTQAYAQTIDYSKSQDYSTYYYYYAQACYYKKVKEYTKALEAIDILLTELVDPDIMQLKTDILFEQGNYEEATLLHKRSIQLTEERNNEAFSRQVTQLRNLYDVNDKELQTHELELSNMKIEQKQDQLLFSLLVLIILLIPVCILIRLLWHSRKLKNALIEEKRDLLEAKDRLYQAKIKAETDSQIKSAFIANISHEIRTPLNAIVGFSSLVTEPPYDEDKSEYITIINKNSDLLLNLINDVLDLSRMEVGNLRFSLAPCELNNCCKELLTSMEPKVASGVKLTLSASQKSFILQTDPLRLKQLLLNLLSNATKFTTAGEINLAFETDNKKRQVKFTITDTGRGIPPEKQAQIFERFEKLDEDIQGTGLGLSICKTIAERLGGIVSIDSAYTTGARFVFIHPYDVPDY